MPRTRDGFTNGVYVLDGDLGKAFAGRVWTATHVNTSLATATNIDVMLRTGASNFAFPTILVAATQPISWSLHEDTTVSAEGTALTAYNRNRATAGSPVGAATHTPTISAVGTVLLNGILVPTSAGLFPIVQGWQLKTNSRHLLRGSNNSGSTASVSVFISWYEQ